MLSSGKSRANNHWSRTSFFDGPGLSAVQSCLLSTVHATSCSWTNNVYQYLESVQPEYSYLPIFRSEMDNRWRADDRNLGHCPLECDGMGVRFRMRCRFISFWWVSLTEGSRHDECATCLPLTSYVFSDVQVRQHGVEV